MHQDATWYGGRPQPRGLWVRWGPSPPLPKGRRRPGQSPQFSAHGYCGRTAGWIKMVLGMEVGLGPVRIVLDGDTAPPQNRGRAPKFSAHLYCGQTAGCIKMPLGTEVGLGLRYATRHCVRCGPSYPQKNGHIDPTQFLAHVYCCQMAGWMKTPLGTEVDLGPGHIVLDGVPVPAKGAQQPPVFSAHVYCGHGRPSPLL